MSDRWDWQDEWREMELAGCIWVIGACTGWLKMRRTKLLAARNNLFTRANKFF
jgi:hypothetical protein